MDRPQTDPTTPAPSEGRRSSGTLARVFGNAERDPRLDWARRSVSRRLLVVTQILVLVLAGALQLAGREVLSLFVFLMFFPLMSLINVGVHGITELPARDLDDILVQVRDRATRRAHLALTVLFGVLALATPFVAPTLIDAVATQDPDVTVRQLTVASLGVFFLVMLLPVWTLAFTLPGDEQP